MCNCAIQTTTNRKVSSRGNRTAKQKQRKADKLDRALSRAGKVTVNDLICAWCSRLKLHGYWAHAPQTTSSVCDEAMIDCTSIIITGSVGGRKQPQ